MLRLIDVRGPMEWHCRFRCRRSEGASLFEAEDDRCQTSEKGHGPTKKRKRSTSTCTYLRFSLSYVPHLHRSTQRRSDYPSPTSLWIRLVGLVVSPWGLHIIRLVAMAVALGLHGLAAAQVPVGLDRRPPHIDLL